MGWKVRSDDGKQALLDIGENSGGILIRGGLTRAAAGGDHRRGPRRHPPAGAGGVRRIRLGNRAVGHQQGEGRAREARAAPRRRPPRLGLPELPRQGSGRLRSSPSPTAPRRSDERAGQREAAGAGAVRADRLEHAVSRSHLLRSARFPPQRGVLPGAPRLDDASRERQSGLRADRRLGGAIIRGNAAARARAPRPATRRPPRQLPSRAREWRDARRLAISASASRTGTPRGSARSSKSATSSTSTRKGSASRGRT